MTAPWQLPDFDAHEGVHFFAEPSSGLNAIIAIHSTHLGPAAGGARFWRYAESGAALTDALRLSRGMSYKNAMAGLPLGGGKGVILAGPDRVKTPELLAAFGRAIESLNGRYVTAEDVGMGEADLVAIGRETRHVSGLPVAGADAAGGDPGPFTADGVFLGVKAAVRRGLGKDSVAGVHVAIQGVGSVGGGLARRLAAEGARLTLADVDAARADALAKELGAATVPADRVLAVEADVVSPCALGAILTAESIAALQAPVVTGGANNQLAKPADGERLRARGILYAPDYVINAGGIINVGLEYLGGERAEVTRRIQGIPERLERIWDEAMATGAPSSEVADRMAQRLIGRG
jgi:leucine dehydrogenase